jgi:CubicO group peptidase (beta-lactamase class C family)
MKLDDPVSKYLPDTVKLPKYNGHEITLSHLATHTAGLPYVPDDLPHDNRVNQTFAEYTTERLYALLSRCVLTNDPGTWVDYSNIGMGLLGHVIALKAGTNYESVVVHDICRPLGMDSTGIRLSTDLKGRLAAGHSPAGKIIPNYGTGVLAGSGGLYSTVRDLLKLVSANIGLTASSLSSAMKKTQSIQHRRIEARFAPEQLYAADWMDEGQCDQTGRELLGHSGGSEGYNSFIGFDKSRRRAVVVLSNQAATMQNGIRAAAVGWFLLEEVRLTPQLALLFSPADRRGSLGIGLGFDHATHTLRVAVVVPDSSAAKAGVSAGFIVNRIDGIPTVNKSIVECGSLLAGNVGTTARLDLIDPQNNRTNAVELTRQRFTPPK